VKEKNTWAPAQAIPKSNKKNWRFMQLTISVIWTWYERINHRRLKIYDAHHLSNQEILKINQELDLKG
jgi:hypothetical protein